MIEPPIIRLTAPAFAAACGSKGGLLINASRPLKGGGWSLWRDDCHPDHASALIALASTRTPTDTRYFKTLDAAFNEAARIARDHGAQLEFRIWQQSAPIAHEHLLSDVPELGQRVEDAGDAIR